MPTLAEAVSYEQQFFTKYQTYEELRACNARLEEEYPDLARVEHIGYGADRTPEYPEGRPIEAIIISDPEHEAERPYALVQFEHENELPATQPQRLTANVTCRYPELLDELGYNLILLNTTHPDGIALQRWVTEGNGEFDPLCYALWFYRSCPEEQIAWGYPFNYKIARFNAPTPEVRASMHIMRKYRPAFLHSVHAAGIDDAHFYLSHPDTELMDDLEGAVVTNGLVMQQGEPEASYVNKMRTGIYSPVLTARAAYDYRARHVSLAAMRWVGGTTSMDYLAGVVEDPFAVLSEVPYLTADALRDNGPAGITRREAGRLNIANQRYIIGRVAYYFAHIASQAESTDMAAASRLTRSIKWWYQQGAPGKLAADEKALEAAAFDRKATTAEAYSTIQRWDFYASLFLGEVHHLARLLGRHGIADDIQGELAQRIESINAVSPLQTSALPQLVGAQALSGLLALRHSRNRYQ